MSSEDTNYQEPDHAGFEAAAIMQSTRKDPNKPQILEIDYEGGDPKEQFLREYPFITIDGD